MKFSIIFKVSVVVFVGFMWGLSAFCTGLPSGTTIPSLDPEFSCFDENQANQFIQDFSIDVDSFGGKELCNNAKDTKKLFNDLQILKEGRFEAQGSSPLIQGFLPINQYYSWMKSETRGVQRGNDVPFATAYNSGGYFTMQNGWALLSTLGRVGTIVHEARHTEGYYHIPCTFGPYANSNVNGCDRNYSYGGSHGIEMEYYARVSEMGSNYHPVYQSMARMMAVARANFVFNQNPLKKRTALAAIDKNQSLYLFEENSSGEVLTLRNSKVTNSGLLKSTSFGVSFFDGIKVWALDLYRNISSAMPISDDYSYFKLIKEDRGQGPAPMLDMEEVDLGQKRYFVYINNKGEMASYDFPHGKWGRLAKTPASDLSGENRFRTTLDNGQQGLFFQHDQNIWQLSPETMSFSKVVSTWNSNTKNVVLWKNQVLLLNQSGQVIQGATGSQFAPFQNINVDQIVSVPLYDSFEVE